MSAHTSKIFLAVFGVLLLLSFLLTSAAGGAVGWYGIMAVCALIPLIAGPRVYRILGAVALAASLALMMVDYRAGLKRAERQRALSRPPGTTLTNGSSQ